MHALRTRFKKDIVSEFKIPSIAVRRMKKDSSGMLHDDRAKVIIYAGGMPGFPGFGEAHDFFVKKGYWVFVPRYRGTWESGGRFLQMSPHKDLLDVVDGISRGFKDEWSGIEYKLTPKKLYLFGSSFGGAAVLLAGSDKRVTKVVARSPVVDWLKMNEGIEPHDWLYGFVKRAFGNAYRLVKRDWNKLQNGVFYNPIAHTRNIDGKKVLIIHAKDDDVVTYKPSVVFARKTGSSLWLLKSGGHLSSSIFMSVRGYKKISEFLKK